jgi:cysteine-rich repeat protein
MNSRVLAFAITAGLGLAPMAHAYFAGGGKDAAKGNDCLIGYEGIDAGDVTLDGKKQVVSCTDCDPACDLDGDDTANGSCTFGVGACINQPGVEGCTPPAGLTKAKASAKVSGVKGKIDIEVPQLLEGSVCGALLDLEVPLTKNGTKDGKGTVKLSAQVKKDKDAGIDKTRKDNDKVTYVCVPRPAGEACPSASTSTTSTTVVTTTTTSTTTTTVPPFVCGDGTLEGTEECDDGNPDPTDGCTRDCTICGNGTVTAPETCDDSNLTSDDGCDANCQTTGCGNGLIVGNETCDDGNTDDQDSCPSDCIVDQCTAETGTDFTVQVNFAGSNDVAGITVFVEYPEGDVSIPGSGASVPTGVITNLPPFAFGQTNDLDHALIQAVVETASFPAGLLFEIHFETCAGAPAPTSGDFACTVLTAGDANLQPIAGVTCSVVIP